jgi:hypothetical protein
LSAFVMPATAYLPMAGPVDHGVGIVKARVGREPSPVPSSQSETKNQSRDMANDFLEGYKTVFP